MGFIDRFRSRRRADQQPGSGRAFERLRMAGLKGAGLETQRAILADGFGVEWPIGPDGHPLSFIAAFALDDLPLVDPLPDSGTLPVYWSKRYDSAA